MVAAEVGGPHAMNDRIEALLEELYEQGRAHDAGQQDRLARLRNVEPATAALLAVLVHAIQPPTILELGTSNGYSTIWLADAARAVAASVTSIDNDPIRTSQAGENLTAAGLADVVELRTEDAAVTLA